MAGLVSSLGVANISLSSRLCGADDEWWEALAEAERIQIKTPESIIFETLLALMRARGANGTVVRPDSKLNQDLGMDSLDLAELSAVLEDELGRDPFSDGLLPATPAELISYYQS